VEDTSNTSTPVQESASNLDTPESNDPLFNNYMGELGKY
jgi:hypothetical protein